MNNDAMLNRAKELAARAINEVVDVEEQVKAEDMYIVWFSKTLKNWKALISTDKLKHDDYVEVTHNGDKNETYVDVYNKSLNVAYPD